MTSSPFSLPAELPAAQCLLRSAIDYAGLFPPAGRSMAEAVASFAAARSSAERFTLGSFVVPAYRLGELEAELLPRLERANEADFWPLSVLLDCDPQSALRAIEGLRERSRERIAVGSFEIAPLAPEAIAALHRLLPDDLEVFYEVPLDGALAARLDAVRAAGASAKVRLGGVRSDAFPPVDAVAGFLEACHERDLPFKATAGLHHLVRGSHPLTGEPGSERCLMHGFVNLGLAAALVHQDRLDQAALHALLDERETVAFEHDLEQLAWRGQAASAFEIRRARRRFFLSFGSCSFDEPVAELRAAGWL